MGDVRVRISVRDDQNKYLTVWPAALDAWYLCVGPVDDQRGTEWIVRDIPGTTSKLLIKDGAAGSGDVVTWVGGYPDHILVRPYRPGWDEQVVKFDELDGGYVAINNHDKTRVMDRSMGPTDQPFVISFRWNAGANQQW